MVGFIIGFKMHIILLSNEYVLGFERIYVTCVILLERYMYAYLMSVKW